MKQTNFNNSEYFTDYQLIHITGAKSKTYSFEDEYFPEWEPTQSAL